MLFLLVDHVHTITCTFYFPTMSHQPTSDDVIDLTEDSHSEEEPMPQVDETVRAQLQLAINSTQAARLRQVIKNLAASDPRIELALVKELVTVGKRSRKVESRWETCENCEEDFDISTRREDDECWYHDGEYIHDGLCR